MGINNYARYSDTFDFNLIKNKIDSNRPVIVNNGWGENNIYLEYGANRRYLDDLVYLNK